MKRPRRGVFQWGDRVQLTDEKGRHHTVSLSEGGELHSHRGVLKHESLIGLTDGSVVANSHGTEYLAVRPLLSDFAMSMPRGAAIVYPKDAAHIVTFGDIFPGAVVVEAGVGSGALSLSLLQAIGETGSLTSFERREEFAEIAAANIEGYFGDPPANHRIVVGNLVEALPSAFTSGEVDRVVLDMLAPWECVDAVAEALGFSDADALMHELSAAARTIAWVSDELWARVGLSLEGSSLRRRLSRDKELAPGVLLQDGADLLREPHFVVDALTDARDLVAAAAAGVAADAARVRGTRRAGAAAGAAALDAAARKLHFLASWARETLVASDEGSSFDRVAAGVESGAAVCSALRSAVCDVLAEQLEFARASEAVVRATHD